MIATAVLVSAMTASTSDAAVILDGSTVAVGGPGTFRFDLTATASGQTETISGFSASVEFDPTIDFVIADADIAFNPAVSDLTSLTNASFGRTGTFDFAAASLNDFLTLMDGETATLVSFDLDLGALADGPMIVGTILDEASPGLSPDIADSMGTPVAAVSVGAPFIADVTSVPEPGTGLAMLIATGFAWRRRHR